MGRRKKIIRKYFNFILPAVALALPLVATATREPVEFLGETAWVVQNDAEHLRVSEACLPRGKQDCQALRELGKISLAQSKSGKSGVNPGSVICRTQLRGQVVVGKTARGNEISFCRFADRSLIDLGSLLYIGRNNDRNP